LFVTVIPGIVVKIRHADRLYAWQSSRAKMERRAYEFHRMLTDSIHAKEVRLFGLGGLFRERYRDLRKILHNERLRLSKSRAFFDLIAQAGAMLSLFGMLALKN
jgi:ATP-binding cassette subfamily B protein